MLSGCGYSSSNHSSPRNLARGEQACVFRSRHSHQAESCRRKRGEGVPPCRPPNRCGSRPMVEALKRPMVEAPKKPISKWPHASTPQIWCPQTQPNSRGMYYTKSACTDSTKIRYNVLSKLKISFSHPCQTSFRRLVLYISCMSLARQPPAVFARSLLDASSRYLLARTTRDYCELHLGSCGPTPSAIVSVLRMWLPSYYRDKRMPGRRSLLTLLLGTIVRTFTSVAEPRFRL